MVYTAVASDVDQGATLTYSLSGTDADKFNINTSTGEVTFKASPNYEAPADSGGNNVYDIVVSASDGTNITTQAVAITVTDVSEVIPGSTFTATSTANETFTGTYGVDTFNFANGTSSFTIGGSGNSGTITGYDTIVGYQSSNGLPGSADILNLPTNTVSVMADINKGNFSDSILTINGAKVQSHSVNSGVITFVTGNNDATLGNPVVVDSTAKLAAVVQYLNKNDIGNAGTTAIFKANIGDGDSTFVYTQPTKNAGGQLYYLQAFADPTNLLTSNTFTTNKTIYATPIGFDIDGNGVHYLDQSFGVTYDYNKDGIAESTAWVGQGDGLLANLDENGKINIVFSTEDGETDLEGLAKVYDINKDGVFDSKDAAFSQFGVWQDSDSNGTVAGGEFKSLAEVGITSISLQSSGETTEAANGDVIIYGHTTYTMADGKTYLAEDVAFATSQNLTDETTAGLVNPNETQSAHSVVSMDQTSMTCVLEPAISSSEPLYLELGGVTYTIEPNQETTINPQTVVVDTSYHVGDPAPLVAGAWTEVVVSSAAVDAPLVATAWTDVVDGATDVAAQTGVSATSDPVVAADPIVTSSSEPQVDPTLSNPIIHNP